MSEKIGDIKEKFKNCKDEELVDFIETYGSDPRSGVISLCSQACKRMADIEKEYARLEEISKYEREYGQYGLICGIDEVGRGPLAGPVVAGAVILPKDCKIKYINDSKKLSAKMRDMLYKGKI